MKKWIPWICAAVCAGWFIAGFQAPKPEAGFDVAAFGRLPMLADGRVQPFDSFARNTLLTMNGSAEVHVTNTVTVSALDWLLDTMTRPDTADNLKIFRISTLDLAGLFTNNPDLNSYAFNDLTNELSHIEAEGQAILKSEGDDEDAAKRRTPYQKDVMHLWESLITYQRLKNTLEPEGTADFQKELEVYRESIGPGRAALEASEKGKPANEEDMQRIALFFDRYGVMARYGFLVVPPRPDEPRQAWSNMGTNLMQTLRSDEFYPPVTNLAAMATAYQNNDPAAFNRAVALYRVWLQENNLYPEMRKGAQEFFFNQIAPFSKSMVIYVAALLLGCIYWINLSEPVRRSGLALLIVAFVIHTIGLVMRMHLEGRPPVTNLYSSAIFIGWGACLLGIILEWIFRGAIGLVVAGSIGFVTLIIAYHLSLGGDTMEMLRAVLDTNMWLATHVVVVTSGYASMFVAGLLAIVYIVRGFFTRTLTVGTAKSLARMVYGIVCFATLFSFVGTILGGIWADQSWGRFWGWDPKENGALLIVLWNAITLHARWGGLVRERGLMAMAVFGNIVTSFSWFGVNMLGIGLHSYGFMEKAFPWLVGFDISQVVLIVISLMPVQHWSSFRDAVSAGPADSSIGPENVTV